MNRDGITKCVKCGCVMSLIADESGFFMHSVRCVTTLENEDNFIRFYAYDICDNCMESILEYCEDPDSLVIARAEYDDLVNKAYPDSVEEELGNNGEPIRNMDIDIERDPEGLDDIIEAEMEYYRELKEEDND